MAVVKPQRKEDAMIKALTDENGRRLPDAPEVAPEAGFKIEILSAGNPFTCLFATDREEAVDFLIGRQTGHKLGTPSYDEQGGVKLPLNDDGTLRGYVRPVKAGDRLY
jgi:hypothetical protein